MAGSINKCIIIGNLGRDPEIRSFQSGGRICNLSVATSENWRDKASGERRERTEWHRVTIYNENLIGVAERFLKKGSKVYLEGQLETRKFEKDGRETYTTEIVLRPYRGELTLLDGASDRQGDGQEAGDDFADMSGGAASKRAPTGSAGLDDEVPF